jgi:pyruvate formate lyase activating enzyme
MISGFMPTSFSDYPARICSTIFIGGCNFRCPYCHNPSIVFCKSKEVQEADIIRHLEERKDKIDAVCITGGEPCIWKDLPKLVKKIKELGFYIKIDTNGSNPEMINYLVRNNMVDYIAMDIKAPLKKYKEVIRTEIDIEKIKQSISFIIKGNTPYEFRTTVHSACTSEQDILTIAEELKGADRYALQEFRDQADIIDPTFIGSNNLPMSKLEKIKAMILKKGTIKEMIVR